MTGTAPPLDDQDIRLTVSVEIAQLHPVDVHLGPLRRPTDRMVDRIMPREGPISPRKLHCHVTGTAPPLDDQDIRLTVSVEIAQLHPVDVHLGPLRRPTDRMVDRIMPREGGKRCLAAVVHGDGRQAAAAGDAAAADRGVFAVLGDAPEQGPAGAGAAGVGQFVGPHQAVVGPDFDGLQALGRLHQEVARVHRHGVRPGLQVKEHAVRRARAAVAGVVDAGQVALALIAGVADRHVVAVRVFDALQAPAENLGGV